MKQAVDSDMTWRRQSISSGSWRAAWPLALGLSLLPSIALTASSGPADPSLKLLRDASLMLLKEGNQRFATGKSQHPNLDSERRTNTVAQGQEPFATILACSDSRDPVELLFDRGIGDLFVVRVAGNVAGHSELATVEYGVDHLHTPLLVVMGHTRCGAVTAVVKGAELHGHLHHLAEKIKPAADQALGATNQIEAAIPAAIQANVWQTISDVLGQSSVVREKMKSGQVQVVGAVYDLETGRVNWLGAHPDQETLLVAPATDPAEGHAVSVEPHVSTPPPSAKQSSSEKLPADNGALLRALSKPPSSAASTH